MSLSSRKLRTPEQSGTAVVEPPFERVGDLLTSNRGEGRGDLDIGGRSATELRRQARAELLDAARQYTAAYRDVPQSVERMPDTILLAGHQPQMFHPGVWLKNFALGRLAERHRAVGINLIIDSDAARPTALRVPDGTGEKPEAASIAFDRPEPAVPYEERRVEDADLFPSFAERIQPRLEPLGIEPLLTDYWPMVRERARVTERLGAAVAQARHQLEAAWGLQTLEIPQSEVCDLPAFQFFTAFLLAELSRFLPVYNGAVVEYRRERRIRSAAHPAPELTVEGQWREAPFWIWTADDPQRRRLFARQTAGAIALSDRGKFEARLPGDNPQSAAERLVDLRRGGVKIRSKALVTTLWARLFLGDLFIHGIGGGNYDLVTDRIIQRFFHIPPPAFMVLSGTLHLPIQPGGQTFLSVPSERVGTDRNVCPPDGNLHTVQRRLRELTYHPEKFLNTNSAGPEVESLTAEKHRWIGTPQTRENARVRCQAIRRINERLQPVLAGERELLLATQRVAVAKAEAEKILHWREYAFCLYPEATLREFLEGRLAELG